jgi:hypothetical protein
MRFSNCLPMIARTSTTGRPSASWAGSANFTSWTCPISIPASVIGFPGRIPLTDSNSMMIGYPSPPNSRVSPLPNRIASAPQRREPYQYKRSDQDILTCGLHDALPDPAGRRRRPMSLLSGPAGNITLRARPSIRRRECRNHSKADGYSWWTTIRTL